MKRKLLSTLLASVMVLSLVGCAKEADTEPATTEPAIVEETVAEVVKETETEAAEETIVETVEETIEEIKSKPARNASSVVTPAELSDDLYDFQISIDGTVYQFPMWASDFEALGWTYDGDASQTLSSNQYTVAETWNKGEISVYTQIANLSMNTISISDAMIAGITLEDYYLDECDWEIILPKGIQFGVSGIEDIIAAYGDPTDDYDSETYYKMTYEKDYYQEINIYVSKETNIIDKIEIENMVELEGADNSVNEEVPDVVKNYKAPAALGNDLYGFDIELEGHLYTLPCPVSELLANGFTINEDNSETAFGAQGSGWLELVYNNQKYHTIVRNYADYATTGENCFLTDIKSSCFEPDYNLVIPCGIKRGDSEDSILAILKDYNYEVEQSENSDFTYYLVYDPEGSPLQSYTIVTENGEVVIIEAETETKPE